MTKLKHNNFRKSKKVTYVPITNMPKTGKIIVIHSHRKGKHKIATMDAKKLKLKGGSAAGHVGTALSDAGAVTAATGVGAEVGVPLAVAGGVVSGVDAIGELFDWW